MIRIITFILAVSGLFYPISVSAQNNVGIGTTSPDTSAALEIFSSDKGMLVPRMTAVERQAISLPANSLLVYDTDSMCFLFYKQPTTTWVNLCNDAPDADWTVSTDVYNSTHNIAIGTTSATARLHVKNTSSTQNYGFRVDNDYTGAFYKYGIYNKTDAGGTGTRYGIYNITYGNAADASPVYGVYSYVSSGAGNRYGIYSSVSTSGTANYWAGYFPSGDTYFGGDMRIGWTADVPGYLLAVDGKIICEDLLLQMSGSWPDYVFDKEYDLLSIEEVKQYIQNNKHLPGVPNAESIEKDGISMGEMSKIIIRKMEELTLYIIQQQEEIEKLKKVNAELLQNTYN